MANVLATFAQFERRLISQRTRDALAAKRGFGDWVNNCETRNNLGGSAEASLRESAAELGFPLIVDIA
jgi:DNA invertase Pin-like site-specific DNA recombinase